MTVRDPHGNKLKLVLLQVVDSDVQGPITLRVRYDHETVKLDPNDERKNKFLMCWVAEDQVLGELRLTDLYQEFEDLKAQVERRQAAKAQLDRDIANIQKEYEKLRDENEQKTAALRELQRERDPEVMQRQISVAVEQATRVLDAELRNTRATNQDLQSKIDELQANKRKLKERIERLEGRR